MKERMSLEAFCDHYINQKSGEYGKHAIKNLKQAKKKLLAFFDGSRELTSFSHEDMVDFQKWLRDTKRFAANTVSLHCRKAKEFFAAAVESQLLSINPCKKLKDLQETRNEERERFMTPEQSGAVLDACPDAEWKVIFCLARFGGMRPSEILRLTWENIRWEQKLIRVPGAKGKHKRGYRMRDLPIFPEIARALKELMGRRPKTVGRIVLGYEAESYIGVQMGRIIANGGVTDWQKPFINLRSTRSTELAELGLPIQDYCRWLGHSPQVALKHYLQVRARSFDRGVEIQTMPDTWFGEGDKRAAS